ncbi:MAG TPA: MFS transporter, partial [Methylomirabilota bacterium]|nr:MFS transporter [Methylomirabilota bacterium]
MTRPFLVLWLGAFAFFLSFLLLLSALPIFARRLGASDAAIGVIMAAFAVTSLLLRPVTGWGADRWGRRPFMLAGSLFFTVASAAYAWVAGALGLVLVRLLHGAGMGLYPTASSAMVADVTPPARRGEIIGVYGIAGSLALAVGPMTGIALVGLVGFTGLFWIAGGVAALSVVTTLAIPETLTRARAIPFTAASVVSPDAVIPSIIELCMMFTYGTQVAFLPLHADTHGVNPGLFFLVFALTIAVTRRPAGRLSDRFGRAPIAAIGLALAAVALVALAFSESALGLSLAGGIYGVGYGTSQPALMAWCVDDVAEHDRGRALATFYSAVEIGIAVGAIASGLAVARWGFTTTFVATAGVAATGGVLALARGWSARRR